MAKKKQEKVVIDLDQLRAQAMALEQLIQGYQEVLNRLEEARVNVQKAIDTIEGIKEGEDILVPADGVGVAYFLAKPANTDKILVHLGVDVYAALPRDQALERLSKRLASIQAEIDRVRSQLAQAASQYNAILGILSQAAAAIQAGKARS